MKFSPWTILTVMATIEEYGRCVAELEAGVRPVQISRVVDYLNRIYGEPWKTPKERERAQGLVARLERLKRQGQSGGPDSDSKKQTKQGLAMSKYDELTTLGVENAKAVRRW